MRQLVCLCEHRGTGEIRRSHREKWKDTVHPLIWRLKAGPTKRNLGGQDIYLWANG